MFSGASIIPVNTNRKCMLTHDSAPTEHYTTVHMYNSKGNLSITIFAGYNAIQLFHSRLQLKRTYDAEQTVTSYLSVISPSPSHFEICRLNCFRTLHFYWKLGGGVGGARSSLP